MLLLLLPSWVGGETFTPSTTIGTQTVGFTAGPLFPIRLMPAQSSKLFGVAAAPSWAITLTDSIGSSWYQGQVGIGVELPTFRTDEPVTAYGIGISPKLLYSFTALGRLRPYLEGGGGPLWTDLGGRVPEQPGQFNFIVWGGAGCSWFLTPQWAVQAGYRFVHISNGGTRHPNSGLNAGMPFVGLSFSFF
ncbi:MAG TPA: acyloxyacyl hydrolase [Nitrospira sp.]|nr:acyloxyacyl hydrolase [Nitrospira sp.]